jgi:hypothetical protein
MMNSHDDDENSDRTWRTICALWTIWNDFQDGWVPSPEEVGVLLRGAGKRIPHNTVWSKRGGITLH